VEEVERGSGVGFVRGYGVDRGDGRRGEREDMVYGVAEEVVMGVFGGGIGLGWEWQGMWEGGSQREGLRDSGSD
jgi:hypothetical protein